MDIAAGPLDEAGGEAFGIVDQDLEDMDGQELLVPAAERELLRALNEPTRPFGEFFYVHRFNSPFLARFVAPGFRHTRERPKRWICSLRPAARHAAPTGIRRYVGAVRKRKRTGRT